MQPSSVSSAFRRSLTDAPATRRTFIAGAAAAATAALVPGPALARKAPSDADVSKLYDAAKREGKVTWWQAGYPQNVCDDIRTAFQAKYPGIEVSFIRQTAQVLYQRMLNNITSNVHEVDVFATADEAHLAALKQKNQLAVHVPPDMDKVYPAFRQLDPDETYQSGSLAFVALNYNPKKIAPAIKTWQDLLDPRFRDQVATGHPAFGGYAGMWCLVMQDKFGWDYFKKLAANKPKSSRSIYEATSDIVSGERLVAAATDAFAYQQAATGASVAVRFPDDDAVLCVNPVAVMKDAPNPNAARLFANFYYSREFATTVAKTYNVPLRTDVPLLTGVRLDKTKYVRVKLDRQIAGIPEVVAKWRETFGV